MITIKENWKDIISEWIVTPSFVDRSFEWRSSDDFRLSGRATAPTSSWSEDGDIDRSSRAWSVLRRCWEWLPSPLWIRPRPPSPRRWVRSSGAHVNNPSMSFFKSIFQDSLRFFAILSKEKCPHYQDPLKSSEIPWGFGRIKVSYCFGMDWIDWCIRC